MQTNPFQALANTARDGRFVPEEVFACRFFVYESNTPLSKEAQEKLAQLTHLAFKPLGTPLLSFSSDGDCAYGLLIHTVFSAHLQRDTGTWLCCAHLEEMCSSTLNHDGRLLISMETPVPNNIQNIKLYTVPEWWHLSGPLPPAQVHKHRAALQSLLKRRQYTAIAGHAARALHRTEHLAAICYGIIPLMMEAVWIVHGELGYNKIIEGLDLQEMAPRPREALLHWLTILGENLRSVPIPPEKTPIERVIAAIRADCSLPYSQQNIAKSLGLTSTYFCRLFLEKTGQHFSAFLTETRMDHAKRLLATHSLSLQEVSERCGYPSKSYFCQVFKKSTGLTPGEYEQQTMVENETARMKTPSTNVD